MKDSRVVPIEPPLLKARIEAYKVPLPPFQPVTDRILVYPLQKADQPDMTAGGIVVADVTKNKVGAQRGLLVRAGPIAIEQLYSHGIALGHIVITARLSPWERSYLDIKGHPHSVLVLRASEVVGSEDLLTAFDRGDLWMEMARTSGEVLICDRESDRERKDVPGGDEGI